MVNRGSEWRRWEPHIHAPGTVLNDQFGSVGAWGTYLTALEGVTPKIQAIAVTDYYVTDAYEEMLRQHIAGRLPYVQLIFPNIEVRHDVAARSGFVNLHLLVSPEDPDHLVEVRRILTRLQFNAHGDRFDCTRDELIRLGKRAEPTIRDDRAALTHCATQFKVASSDGRRNTCLQFTCRSLETHFFVEECLVARGQHVFAQHPVDTPTDQMHSHSFGASQNGSEWKTWVGGRLGPLG